MSGFRVRQKKIAEVSAFRFFYKCGHRGKVVARCRGDRARVAALKRAERLANEPCDECDEVEREGEV